jgi:hypothetical protein
MKRAMVRVADHRGYFEQLPLPSRASYGGSGSRRKQAFVNLTER